MSQSQRGAVEFRAARKNYGAFTAIPQLDLRIEPGELVTLLGPSGCGKTTTLRMLAGLETPTEGAILIGGQDVTRLPPNRRDVTMVFQSYALFPHMSVAQNVAYGLESGGMSRAMAAEAAAQGVPIKLGALRGSAANRFYQRHGFRYMAQRSPARHTAFFIRYPDVGARNELEQRGSAAVV